MVSAAMTTSEVNRTVTSRGRAIARGRVKVSQKANGRDQDQVHGVILDSETTNLIQVSLPVPKKDDKYRTMRAWISG